MKISLIIPVYNTANYLKDCLDSCLHQKPFILNEDYEIICVNDGSTDASRQILAEYESQGIIIIDQKNAGVSVARNNGLLHAKGNFIWFIDSDDYIEENILSELLAFITSNQCDCCIIGFTKVEEQTQRITIFDKSKFQKIEAKQWNGGRNFAYPWIHIVSRKFLQNHAITFEPGISHQEDTLWMFWIDFFKAKSIYTAKQIYAYRIRANSAMHNRSKENRLKYFKGMLAMLQAYQKALTHYGDSLSVIEQNHLQHRIYWSVQNILFNAIRIDKRSRHDLLNNLIKEGLYPYPILWRRLSLKYGINNLLINIFCLLFPYKWYYQLVSGLLGSKK